jgi:Lrp/AsnC family transcriptional regulator for asnA, asnC and gidA
VAVVDPKATDATISAFLLLTVSPPEIGAALDQLRARTEVRYLSQVVGRGQVMAEVFFRDLQHLLGFQNEVLAALPGIGGVETLLVGQVHKLSYEWEI